MSRGEVCIVIPCHNEAACIRGVLDSLRRSQPEASLVVVNDCSTDATGEVLAGYPDVNNHHIDAVRYAVEGVWRRRGA